MKHVVKLGRAFYAIALIVYGLQQLYFGTFRNVFVSAYQYNLPLLRFVSYAFGIYLIATAMMIVRERSGRKAALLLAGILLFLFFFSQLPYQFFTQPNKLYHLGVWTNQLKEVAICGGALVVAGSFNLPDRRGKIFLFLDKMIPYGNLFFLLTMFCFGLCHLVYSKFLINTLPPWWPDHLFWVYFTGVALIGSSFAIALGIRIRVVAFLQAVMIFLWVWMMHMPSALKRPISNRGDLVASAFDAVAFSGIAILIAVTMKEQAWIIQVERWQASQPPEKTFTKPA
jgi:uncharacterized membrane protein YphA (DoxX/SURF4 family)